MSKSFFQKLKVGLSKTKENLSNRIDEIITFTSKFDEDFYEELEEILILSDIGMETTEVILQRTKEKIKENTLKSKDDIKEAIKNIIKNILQNDKTNYIYQYPLVLLVVGVNGVGKTTTIAKLANRFKDEGKKVILAAGDTFRAAAVEQLNAWADKIEVEIIKNKQGADPASVIYDSLQAAKARNADILICDTAGRLHNKKNLMNELSKINKVIENEKDYFNKYTLLVLDATTGQNAVSQAKVFSESCNVDGIALTKLDGTSKGGIIIAIKSILDIPVRYIGVGEKMEDLQEFQAQDFVDALFE